MAEQIVFFEKNRADFTYTAVTASASEGDEFALNVINRSNNTAWLTTNSLDANNTTLTIDFADEKSISDILLIKHNFKSFNLKWWDGSAFQAFTPPINETTNTKETNYYEVSQVTTSQIQLTILGTMVPDSDKFLYQLIATEKLGQFEGWPIIKSPTISRNRNKTLMLSGKMNVFENIGNFGMTLQFNNFSSDADLALIEALYEKVEGFLVWPCGGDETQFRTIRQGYRLEDIFLMKPLDEYVPEYDKGIYKNSVSFNVKLQEVTE
jgi:hypothetical protein